VRLWGSGLFGGFLRRMAWSYGFRYTDLPILRSTSGHTFRQWPFSVGEFLPGDRPDPPDRYFPLPKRQHCFRKRLFWPLFDVKWHNSAPETPSRQGGFFCVFPGIRNWRVQNERNPLFEIDLTVGERVFHVGEMSLSLPVFVVGWGLKLNQGSGGLVWGSGCFGNIFGCSFCPAKILFD
jgi:hypothetical protein